MYVAVKGGEKAIGAAHRLMEKRRRGNTGLPELSIEQVRAQLGLAVDRVMAEGSLYAPCLAALAVKQARGDLVEAICGPPAPPFPVLATANQSIRTRWRWSAVFQPPGKTCRAASFWGRPSITPTVFWITA